MEQTQWSEETRTRFAAEVEALSEAVRRHGAAVLAAAGEEPQIATIMDAGDELARAVDAYGDAQFELTGTAPPVHVHGHEHDEEPVDGDEVEVVAVVRVLHRADFAVVDLDAVITAGRAAYAEVWPEDSAEEAEADVTDLGRALYQVQHAGGLSGLEDVPGLLPAGSTTWYVDVSGDEEPPEDPFGVDPERVLFQLDEVVDGDGEEEDPAEG